jgi:hypothetical protein
MAGQMPIFLLITNQGFVTLQLLQYMLTILFASPKRNHDFASSNKTQ